MLLLHTCLFAACAAVTCVVGWMAVQVGRVAVLEANALVMAFALAMAAMCLWLAVTVVWTARYAEPYLALKRALGRLLRR